MVKVKVKRVVEISNGQGQGAPLIINFEHGQVNPAAARRVGKKLTASVYESVPTNRSKGRTNQSQIPSKTDIRKRLAIVRSANGMTYVGSSDNSLNADTSTGTRLRTFIGVRRKKKLSLYEANSIIVSPLLEHLPHLKVKDSSDNQHVKSPEEKRAAQIDLVKAFGSKKKRLTYERMEKHKIDGDHMDVSMNTASASAIMPEENDMPDQKDATILELVPPCNRETKDVFEVYQLRDFLSTQEMDDLTEAAEQWLNCSSAQIKEWRDAKKFSDYFFEMWKRLSTKKHDPRTLDKAKMVLYTELLICLLKLKFTEMRKKVPGLPTEFPSWIVQKALQEFTSMNASGLRCRSEFHKDKTCCYVMALVLLANDLVFDVQLMSTSLQIHIKKLLTLAKAVGITIQHNASTKEYKGLLKLPLPKPIQKRGRTRNIRR